MRPNRSVSIKVMADQVNLSIATISRTRNSSHEVSASTRRNKTEMATLLVAVLVPEVMDSFFSQAIHGIERVAQEKVFHVVIYQTNDDPEKERSILNLLQNARVDGDQYAINGYSQGVSGLNGRGEMGYTPPCPP